MALDVMMAEPLPTLNLMASADPDVQATITDFVDYTELFPSDLIRSLSLIGKLDRTYRDAAFQVHDLTKTFGALPSIPADARPAPQALRADISRALDHAIASREAAFAEATRLLEVAQRHTNRLSTIKRKLKELPQPPSRDPTPPPVSPQLTRGGRKQDTDKGPRVSLLLDAFKHKALKQQKILIPGDVLPPGEEATYSVMESDDDHSSLDILSDIHGHDELDFSEAGGRHKSYKSALPKIKVPKLPKSRVTGGDGGRSRIQVAGISTSNALALLTPPPAEAKPGSRFRPWLKLTDYEMAVLRKQMKKNAVWTPSETMIRRELARTGRGLENYMRAKAEADATGEPFIDDDPLDPHKAEPGPGEISLDHADDLINRGVTLNEAKKQKRERERAAEREAEAALADEGRSDGRRRGSDAFDLQTPEQTKRSHKPTDSEQKRANQQSLEEANRRLAASSSVFQNLFAKSNTSPTQEDMPRTTRKRKRDVSKELTPSSFVSISPSTQDTTARMDGPKKIRLTLPANSATGASRPGLRGTQSSVSPVKTTVVTRTEKIPLAPEGPSTSPNSFSGSRYQQSSRAPSVQPSDARRSVTMGVQPTAAQSRPRRTSGGTQKRTPPLSPGETSATTGAEKERGATKLPSPRPRSRGSGATRSMKAASAEPSSRREARELRELRRASVVEAHPASDPPPVPNSTIRATRAGRRAVPGVVTADEDGKSKVSLGKRRAAPKKKGLIRKDDRKENEEPVAVEEVEDIDPNEERYCVCNDVSWGVMIACENEQCEREWFHLPCVGLQEIPPRRSKWYCADCRERLRIDEKGRSTEAAPFSAVETRSGRR